jgi:hypothetical protein
LNCADAQQGGRPTPPIIETLNALQSVLSQLSKVLVAVALAQTTSTTPIPAQNLPSAAVLGSKPTPAEVFAKYPILRRIASCESSGNVNAVPRQFLSDGTPLWGEDPVTKIRFHRDVGILQINTKAHAAELAKLGLDVVNSETDNVYYAEILYERSGTEPWVASMNCWKQ